MAVNQISTSVSIISSLKGFAAVNLDSMATSSVPTVLSGSILEVASAFFSWDSNETPNASSWTAISTGSSVYMQCTPSGSAGTQIITTSYTTTAPTWVGSKNGWYASAGSNVRVIAGLKKNGATSYDGKVLLGGEGQVSVGASGRVALGSQYMEKWDTDIHSVLEGELEAITLGAQDGTSRIYLFVNQFHDGAGFKAKAAGVSSVAYLLPGQLAIGTSVTASAGTAVTNVYDMVLSGNGGTTTTLNLGGAAGGSARSTYIAMGGTAAGTSAGDSYIWNDGNQFRFFPSGEETLRLNGTSTLLYVQTTASAANLNIASSSTLSVINRSTSSFKYKSDVSYDVPGELVDALRPIVFKSKCDADDKSIYRFGFGAEDVHSLGYPGLVHYLDTKDGPVPDGVQYPSIIPLLVAKVQDLERRLKALEGKA